MTDFKEYDSIHSLSVIVDITKRITRTDIIQQLMNNGEVAFKSDHSTFIIDISKIKDIELIKKLTYDEFVDYINKLEGVRK